MPVCPWPYAGCEEISGAVWPTVGESSSSSTQKPFHLAVRSWSKEAFFSPGADVRRRELIFTLREQRQTNSSRWLSAGSWTFKIKLDCFNLNTTNLLLRLLLLQQATTSTNTITKQTTTTTTTTTAAVTKDFYNNRLLLWLILLLVLQQQQTTTTTTTTTVGT